jgi:class 3 adenylate cyclase/predicted ATPase
MSEIRDWLEGLGLGAHADAFEAEQIDLDALPDITETDLKEMGLPIGPRRKLLRAVAGLATVGTEPEAPPAPREAERRQITVMFCDLVGSTALSEQLDPEDLRGVMQAYRKACSDVIARYDGHVAQYLGDGVMVYFGWPAAHEDDAGRAVRGGLDIVDAVAALESEAALAVRIGIATGLVVVGESEADDGTDAKLAVGETPNIAARIQGLAAPGTVAIAQSTRRLLGGAFALDDLGTHDAKGVASGLQVHQVIGAAETESRFDASQGGALTPLVGRETEIAMLIERWDQAKDGESQVVLLSGEAGIGKSRVTQVLRERLADEPHTRLRYQCSPYYSNSAFYPVIVQLERAAGFARDDRPDAKLDKLEALFGQEHADTALIAALLSLPIDRYPPLVLSPQKQKENTIAALAGQVTALATDQPVLMIFEDAHWIDPTTLETIGAVIEAIRDHPVLLVITHRPEFKSPWTGHAHVTPLALGRLGRKLGANMVAKVTGGKALPDEVLDQIVAKTDGIPLFVEELTKTVLEAGFLKKQEDRYALDGPLPPLAIPATLQDSLMARLDRLVPVKDVAQIGACIGREFSYELLAAVSPLRDNELQDSLQQLINSELIFRRGTAPASIYTFKHALVQDSAYESLLKSRRQEMHGRIANVLKERSTQTVRTSPELIAHHYTEAQSFDDALPFWLEAGQRASRKSANEEAIVHLNQGLAIIRTLPETPERRITELDFQALLGPSLIARRGYTDETVAAYNRAYELSETIGNTDELFPILYGLWVIRTVHDNEHVQALGFAEKVIEMARAEPEVLPKMLGYRFRGTSQFFLGRLLEGQQDLETSLSLYEPAKHDKLAYRYGQDPTIAAQCILAWNLVLSGFADQALAVGNEAITRAEALDHAYSSAWALNYAGTIVGMLRGDWDRTDQYIERLLSFAEDQSFPVFVHSAHVYRGWRRASLGASDGLAEIEMSETQMRHEYPVHRPMRLAMLAEAQILHTSAEEAQDTIIEALKFVAQTGERFYEAELYQLSGRALRSSTENDNIKAEKAFARSIEIARGQNAKLWELRAATSLARLWQSQDKTAEAHALLTPVYDWFTEGFDTADLIEAKAFLDELAPT